MATMFRSGRADSGASTPASSTGYYEDEATQRIRAPKTQSLWRLHDTKAQKSGTRGTIYWVGKSIIGEDGTSTGKRAAGASYYGEWNDNKKTGYGVQTFPNGQKYEGQWANGMRNGEGTLWVPVGKNNKLRKLYVGGWKDDKRHGKGTCFFKNSQFFQGSWEHGQMHGEGQLRYENGDLYIGEWHDGQRSGQGTLNKVNGDCYEGFWLNDKREGSGSFFYADSGKVFVGEWANDLPKAGVYTQAHAHPEQATSVPRTTELPAVRLAVPNEVLEGALVAVRGARKAHRAKNTPVQRLFAREELEALREAFLGAVRAPDGALGVEELQELCMQLGSTVSQPRMVRLLKDAALPEDPRLQLEDFLRFVALLLDEEAGVDMSQTAETSFDAVGGEDWDELDDGRLAA